MAESEEELRSLLKVIEESEKAGLKLNIQKTKIMASGPFNSLSHVGLFATPWTAASQASLSCTISWSLLMSVESVILSNAGLLNRETYSPPLSMNTFQNP